MSCSKRRWSASSSKSSGSFCWSICSGRDHWSRRWRGNT